MKIFNFLLFSVLLISVSIPKDSNAQHQFDRVGFEEIRSTALEGKIIYGSDIYPDTIILYRTKAGRFGKLLIKSGGYNLTIKWMTFNPDGSLHRKGDHLVIRGTYSCDLDSGREIEKTLSDFWWRQLSERERRLEAQNGAAFNLYSKFRIQNIKPIHTSPSKVSWQVEYYIPPSYSKECFIGAYIPNKVNQNPLFRYKPALFGPFGVPKGQYSPKYNAVVFEAEYVGFEPYFSSTIEVVIYERGRILGSSIINWGQTWTR